jgi:hypothetical protein
MTQRSKHALVALISLGALFIGIGIGVRQVSSSARLNRYLAGLRANGDRLTFTEIAVSPSTNVEYVPSRQLFASNAYLAGKTFTAPGLSPKLMEIVTPGIARVTWRGALHLDFRAGGSPTTNSLSIGTWTDFDHGNEVVAGELEKFRRVLENPAPDTGWVYRDTFQNITNAPVRFYFRHRAVAFALADAEIGALHRRDLDAAIINLRALIGLAQLSRDEPILVIQMFRITVAELDLRATWEALQAQGWTDTQLASLQADLGQLNLFDGLERGLMGERAATQTFMQEVREAKGSNLWNVLPLQYFGPRTSANNNFFVRCWRDQIAPMAYKTTAMDDDELFRWQHLTREVELARALKSNRPWPAVRMMETNAEALLNAAFSRKRLFPLIASGYSIPNTRRIVQSAVQTETLRRLAIAAIALKRHQLLHTEPPPNLAALVPQFLDRVPIDPMSGKPICYRANSSGFILYSVGEDGLDDGGQGGAALWNGPDALWPTAATPEDAPSEQAAGVPIH